MNMEVREPAEKRRKTRGQSHQPAPSLAENDSCVLKGEKSSKIPVLNGVTSAADDTSVSTVPIMCQRLLDLEGKLSSALKPLRFSEPVTYVYNPLVYASETHIDFTKKYCRSTKQILFLGMNPGPFGMAQNGVPFGETSFVKNWLSVKGNVSKPELEHPKRPIQGLDCERREVSGFRFWDFLQETCQTPDNFFRHCFVHNYCPLVFMAKSGKNITPPMLAVNQRKKLMELCDSALVDMVQLLEVNTVIGVGKFAEERTKNALKEAGIEGVKVDFIMHPSPVNPAANKDWKGNVTEKLTNLGIMKILQSSI